MCTMFHNYTSLFNIMSQNILLTFQRIIIEVRMTHRETGAQSELVICSEL